MILRYSQVPTLLLVSCIYLDLRDRANQERDEVDDECSFVDTGPHSEGCDEAHSGDQEREGVEDEGSFVDEGSQPVEFNGDQEPSWASSGAAVSSIEKPGEKMCAVGRWVEDSFRHSKVSKTSLPCSHSLRRIIHRNDSVLRSTKKRPQATEASTTPASQPSPARCQWVSGRQFRAAPLPSVLNPTVRSHLAIFICGRLR